MKSILNSKFLKIGLAGSSASVPILFLTKVSNYEDLRLASGSPSENGDNILKVGSKEKTIKDILKDYLKTASGAKTFAEKFSEKTLLNFLTSIKSKYKNSSIKDKFTSILDDANGEVDTELKKFSDQEKREELILFGGEEKEYKNYNLLKKLKEKFINALFEQNTLNINGEYTLTEQNFKKENINLRKTKRESKEESKKLENSISFENQKESDELKKKISELLQFIFEDFVRYERPLPIQKLTWKYDQSSENATFKKYTEANKNYNISEKPDYFFPSFSKETEDKFEKFLTAAAEVNQGPEKKGIENENLSQYSDRSTYLTVPISSLFDDRNSSQFVISMLNFYSNFSERYKYEKEKAQLEKKPTREKSYGFDFFKNIWTGLSNWFQSRIDTVKKQFQTIGKKFQQTFNSFRLKVVDRKEYDVHCASFGDKDKKKIQQSLESSKNGKLLSLFCINDTVVEKVYEPTGSLSDFVLFETGKSQQNITFVDEYWFFYRDKEGVHAITREYDISKENNLESIKKTLLLHQFEKKNNYKKKEYSFDLFSEMKKHFNRHFERLFLEFYDKFLIEKISEGKKYHELTEILKEFLLTSHYSRNIFELRKAMIRDYESIVTISPEISEEKEPSEKKLNHSIGFAGTFPYKINYSQERDISGGYDGYSGKDYLVKELETIYENIEIFNEDKKNKQFSEKLNVSFEKYKRLVDSFFQKRERQQEIKTIKRNHDSKSTIHFQIEEEAKIIPEISSLFESIWVSGLKKKEIEKLLIQEQLRKGIEDYFDFESVKYKDGLDDDSDGDNRQLLKLFANKSENGSQSFSKEVLKNYLIEKNLTKYLSSEVPHLFGSWKYEENKADESLYQLFRNIDYKTNYLYSPEGLDLIGSKNKNLFWELFTIDWFSKNNFENFRLYLKEKIKEDQFAAFLFSQKYSKENEKICQAENKEVRKDQIADFEFKENINNWTYNPYLMGKDPNSKSKSKWDKCGTLEENYKFSRVSFNEGKRKKRQAQKNTSKLLTGYKGIVTKDSELLPEPILEKITKNKVNWKDLKSLTSRVQSAKTFDQIEKIIEKLKEQFPNIDWTFVSLKENYRPKSFNFDWRSSWSTEINTHQEKINLEDKKKILTNYLKNKKQLIVDKNMSWNYINSKQNEFITQTKSGKLINKDQFKDYFGSLEGDEDEDGGKNYLIKDNDENIYKVFLIQIKHDHLLTSASFKQFLKTIHSDLLIKEIIKASKDLKIQQKAISESIFKKDVEGAQNQGKKSEKKIEKIEVYDERVLASFSREWIIR